MFWDRIIVRSRKGQMEAVGLVIIVILITLGMLFMAQFALKESPTKKIFTRKGLAYSTMSSLMKTTVADNCVQNLRQDSLPQIGKDLLEDCALHADTMPDGYSLYRCGGEHSCAYVEERIGGLLNETLGTWHKKYEFVSDIIPFEGKAIELLRIGEGCPKNKERDSSGTFPIQVEGAGLVQSVLYVCE